MNDLLNQLAQPFEPKYLTWKPGSVSNGKCLALAYADLRAYMHRLDEVCGMDWRVEFEPWGDKRIIARLTIQGVTRSSTGESDAQDEKNNTAGTSAEAQAFKRACAMWGLGRYLYDLPSAWVPVDSQSKKISKTGQAELDKRYKDWYNRTMAASAKRSHDGPDDNDRPTIDPATGEILDSADAGIDNPWNSDAPAPASEKVKTASQAQLARLHILGTDFYGSKAEWDKKRAELVKAATTGAKSSSKELLPKECDLLIKGLEKRLKEKQAAQQPAMAAAA